MPIRIGDQNIASMYVGDQRIAKAYSGADLVYEASRAVAGELQADEAFFFITPNIGTGGRLSTDIGFDDFCINEDYMVFLHTRSGRVRIINRTTLETTTTDISSRVFEEGRLVFTGSIRSIYFGGSTLYGITSASFIVELIISPIDNSVSLASTNTDDFISIPATLAVRDIRSSGFFNSNFAANSDILSSERAVYGHYVLGLSNALTQITNLLQDEDFDTADQYDNQYSSILNTPDLVTSSPRASTQTTSICFSGNRLWGKVYSSDGFISNRHNEGIVGFSPTLLPYSTTGENSWNLTDGPFSLLGSSNVNPNYPPLLINGTLPENFPNSIRTTLDDRQQMDSFGDRLYVADWINTEDLSDGNFIIAITPYAMPYAPRRE